MFYVSRCETAWKCTVGSWHGDYSPCCFALTLITWSNYFLYGSLATVFPDHYFSTDYGSSLIFWKVWLLFEICSSRSSRPEVFLKKGVLRNSTKFTRKHLCQSLFFNKVAGFSPATLLKNRLWNGCFPVNFVKFLRTSFYIEDFWWLLL